MGYRAFADFAFVEISTYIISYLAQRGEISGIVTNPSRLCSAEFCLCE